MALASTFEGRLRLPVIAAPMFIVTGPELVIASCTAGISCAIPALNNRSTEGLAAWIEDIAQQLSNAEDKTGKPSAPFGVNLIVHPSNPRLRDDLAEVVKSKVPYVVTSLGAVPDIVKAIHGYGGIVLHDVTQTRHAEKAMEAGVDGVIAVTAGAGGHAGTINPFALLSELRPIIEEKTLALAGALSTGRDIAAAIAAGADMAYMGTRFIATQECRAAPEYKQMIVEAGSKDIIYTPNVSGVPANFLAKSLTNAGIDTAAHAPKQLDIKDEAKAWSTIWSAGHGSAAIHSIIPVSALVDELAKEFAEAQKNLSHWT